jgi:hypothetical protein
LTPESKAPDLPSGLLIGPSWQEQDAILRDLWLQNKTPQEISVVLSRSIAAIMTRAARLGLPRRSAPGRKPGMSLPKPQVRASTPRSSRAAAQESETPSQVSTRICLMCLHPFQSQGRHNRICPSCKSSSEYESAVALADIHFPI